MKWKHTTAGHGKCAKGGCSCPQAGGVSAGELGASHPAYHPVAADLNQLASGVRPRNPQLVLARLLPNMERPFRHPQLQWSAAGRNSALLMKQTSGVLGNGDGGSSAFGRRLMH